MIFDRSRKTESFERIRARMMSNWLLEEHNACNVIAFTSWLPREGVSTIVAGMARAFGAGTSRKVLVLDVSPGQQRVSSLLKVKSTEVKLEGSETEGVDPLDFIIRDESSGIDILTLALTGRSASSDPQAIRLLLDRLRPNYRVILIDAGALTSGDGAHWLACSNYRVLVIDTAIATRETLEHQRKGLEHSGLTLDGSILNKRAYPIPGFLYWLAR